MTRQPWVLVLAAALVAGCASFAGSARTEESRPERRTGADDAPAGDVDELKRRVLELQRESVMAQVELERLRRQLAELEARLAGGAPTSRPGGEAEPYAPPPAVEESDLPATPVDVGAPEAAAPEVAAPDVAESVAVFESEEGAPPVVPEPPAGGGSAADEPITAAAQAVYDRGYTLYHQGRYVDAETSFQQYLQSYPRTELTDNAQYWVGECRFARGDFRGALAAFQVTVDRFPDGNKIADAILKMGDAHQALGETERARERWEEVRRRFPGSAAAAVAEERLAG